MVGQQRRISLRRIAGPEPDERRPLNQRVAADAHLVRNQRLRWNPQASSVLAELQTVIGASQRVALDMSLRQRHAAMRTAVVECDGVAGLCARRGEVLLAALPPQYSATANLVRKRDDIPGIFDEALRRRADRLSDSGVHRAFLLRPLRIAGVICHFLTFKQVM